MSFQESPQPPWPREPSEKELEALAVLAQQTQVDGYYDLESAAQQLGTTAYALRQHLLKLGHKMVPNGLLPRTPHHSIESIINAGIAHGLIDIENNE